MATYQARYDNALASAGGSTSSPLFQSWLQRYGQSATGAATGVGGAVPYGGVASDVNSFMTDEALAPFIKNLPNYAGMVGQRSNNITSELAGQLPADVMQNIEQSAAERAVGGGVVGSGNANAAMLRALGLNSLQLQQQGSADLSSAIKDTPVPELWNPMSLYVPETLGKQQQAAAAAGLASGQNFNLYSPPKEPKVNDFTFHKVPRSIF